jgi:hypothetical protein
MRAKGHAPKGLQNSALGFNPGNPQNKQFALKGREMGTRSSSHLLPRKKNEYAIGTPSFGLVRTFDLASIQGASLWVVGSQR